MVRADPSATRQRYAELLAAIKREHPGARRSAIALCVTLAQFHLAERGERRRLIDVGWEVAEFLPPPRGEERRERRPDIAGAYYLIQADEGTGEDGS